jgi:hypothetical protein
MIRPARHLPGGFVHPWIEIFLCPSALHIVITFLKDKIFLPSRRDFVKSNYRFSTDSIYETTPLDLFDSVLFVLNTEIPGNPART